MLSHMIYYFPLDSRTIDALDFVALNQSSHVLKEKILYFNKVFEIIPVDQIKTLCQEINNLCATNFDWARIKAQESTLYLWDLIENSSPKNLDGSKKYEL